MPFFVIYDYFDLPGITFVLLLVLCKIYGVFNVTVELMKIFFLQSHGGEEELSEGRSDGDVDHDEGGDSCDEGMRRHHQEHPADVLAKLKMQVRDIKVNNFKFN